MIKVLRVGESREKFNPVFNVSLNIGDFGIENISQSVLAQEDVTDHSHALRILILRPDLAETHHRREDGLQLRQFFSDPLIRRRSFLADAAEQSFILLNVGDDSLPVVFGDVLSLVAGDPIWFDPGL
jgi:hypothetical protein